MQNKFFLFRFGFDSVFEKNSYSVRNEFQVRVFFTRSSAVAKRLCDASCLSVVSFNGTKRRLESFIVSYVGYRFITACS